MTLYGKPGCHLCDDAKIVLERLRSRYPTVIEEVDITRDPALFRLYDIRIPVLEIGDITLEAPIREAELRQALTAATKRPAARGANRSS
ncbi:MAG: glutaredoxin family protein [Chloroflexota bacterium]|nr:glutaredoxin family protein [Chloroflexota bacterium]